MCGLAPAHGLRGSRSHKARGRGAFSFQGERKEGREKLLITILRAGVGGSISIVLLRARAFLAKFLVLLLKHIVEQV